jgi:predicted small integral membrane protein
MDCAGRASHRSAPEACRLRVIVLRLAKVALVAAVAFYASLVAFGNVTDYGSNLEFVRHVLDMDTIFPNSTIRYRALTAPWIHTVGYCLIIAAELLTATLCWIGAYALMTKLTAGAAVFNRAKTWAVGGLASGFLTWQVVFMSIGGEWFGMWMSTQWNGIESAFRVSTTIIAVLIFVALPDSETQEAAP